MKGPIETIVVALCSRTGQYATNNLCHVQATRGLPVSRFRGGGDSVVNLTDGSSRPLSFSGLPPGEIRRSCISSITAPERASLNLDGPLTCNRSAGMSTEIVVPCFEPRAYGIYEHTAY